MGLRTVFIISALLAVSAGGLGDNLADITRNDTCDYSTVPNMRCGDQCISGYADCQCGNETFIPWRTDQYCCLPPGGTCTTEPGRDEAGDPVDDGVCIEGRTLSMSSRCENTTRSLTCHNAYQVSEVIGPRSHFICPHTCVPWDEMCRGLDWCPGEPEVCGPDLRCPVRKQVLETYTKHNISSSGSSHHYCAVSTHINNKQYDSIDRDDEKQLETGGSALDIDISSFPPCDFSGTNPGVKCGFGCRGSYLWCNVGLEAYLTDQCDTKSELISTADSRLCSNPKVWRNVTCTKYLDDGRLKENGIRCNGTNMGCTIPWYTSYDGRPSNPKCSDRSDEIFEMDLTCRQHLQKHLDFHNDKFCNENYPEVNNKMICTNKNEWLKYWSSDRSDPHNCQSSCANSSVGLDCIACSNSSYFSCFKSSRCIPPELVCDGHPQCPNGEDEDLDFDNCHDKYIKNHVVEPYASYRCNSIFYDGMEVYATPCNDKIECADGSGKSL